VQRSRSLSSSAERGCGSTWKEGGPATGTRLLRQVPSRRILQARARLQLGPRSRDRLPRGGHKLAAERRRTRDSKRELKLIDGSSGGSQASSCCTGRARGLAR